METLEEPTTNTTRPDHSGSVLNLYKAQGETPRERLERLRMQNPHYAHEVLSYAGRLDPMAEGVLVCLVAGANKRRDTYLEMKKEYVLDVLFGFSSDTYDILGRVMETGDPQRVTKKKIAEVLKGFCGEINQEYPPYSSQTVQGKSLFEWARSGAIGALVLPRRAVMIEHISIEGLYKVTEPDLLNYIETSIAKVNGDFRQEEIVRVWRRHLRPGSSFGKERGEAPREFPCATLKISCSSGTYARSIANALGLELGTPALSLHILRTKVGEYTVEKSLK